MGTGHPQPPNYSPDALGLPPEPQDGGGRGGNSPGKEGAGPLRRIPPGPRVQLLDTALTSGTALWAHVAIPTPLCTLALCLIVP